MFDMIGETQTLVREDAAAAAPPSETASAVLGGDAKGGVKEDTATVLAHKSSEL